MVDDISDTGKSLTVATKYIQTMNPSDVRTATLILLEGSSFKPDFYGEVNTWRWVVFPWNYVEDMCNLIPRVSENASLTEIRAKMKENFDLELSEDDVEKMLNEIKRRKG